MSTRIEAFEIRNFKRFGDPGIRVSMAPVTLLFGANSIGKSSIIQALLLLAQSWAQAEENIIWLVPNGPLVQLGSFYNFRHRSAAEGYQPDVVSFAFELSDGMTIELRYQPSSYEAPDEDAQGVVQVVEGLLSKVVFKTKEGDRFEFAHDQLTTEVTWDEAYLETTSETAAALLGFDPMEAADLHPGHPGRRGLNFMVSFTGTAASDGRVSSSLDAYEQSELVLGGKKISSESAVLIRPDDIDEKYQRPIARARERAEDLVRSLLRLRHLLIEASP